MESENFVFSYGENAEGRMVHVDTVPRGKHCGCVCPYCKEPLLARHGEVNVHGFAHNSETRQANLKICYKVTMYKLAEQILREYKQIYAPSYYNVLGSFLIDFEDVQVDRSFGREDHQPEVVATTINKERYLLHLFFDDGSITDSSSYKDIAYLEIDLSHQKLETLENFLLKSEEDKKWRNNPFYFNGLKDSYETIGMRVKAVLISDCNLCRFRDVCPEENSLYPSVIENNSEKYRLCDQDVLESMASRVPDIEISLKNNDNIAAHNDDESSNFCIRSCFNCMHNLVWMNRYGRANCGRYQSLNISNSIDPEYAKECFAFKPKK